jgi:hypothetical protein
MHLTDFHTHFPGGVRWRLDRTGVEVEGEGFPSRAASLAPAQHVWHDFGALINAASVEFDVPGQLIAATAVTESGGNPHAVRQEPGFVSDETTPNLVSPGLMQTLISTARQALGDPTINRQRLLNPQTSIRAGTSVISRQRNATGFDPVLVAAAYNAGSLRHTNSNRWRLVHTPDHIDRFIANYNALGPVIADSPVALEIPDDACLQHGWRACPDCGALFFEPTAQGHVCPADSFTPAANVEYSALHFVRLAHAQPGWCWCRACGCLFFEEGGPLAAPCAARPAQTGGEHDATESGEYSVYHELNPMLGEPGWRFCSKCWELIRDPNNVGLPCAAGGVHDFRQSGRYGVPVRV